MERSTIFLMGKSTISMAMFNSYVSLPRGYPIFRQTHAFSNCCGRKNNPHNVKAQRTPTEGFFNRAWRRRSPNHATTLVSFLQAAIYDIIIHNSYTNRHVYTYTYTIYHIYIYHVSYIYIYYTPYIYIYLYYIYILHI